MDWEIPISSIRSERLDDPRLSGFEVAVACDRGTNVKAAGPLVPPIPQRADGIDHLAVTPSAHRVATPHSLFVVASQPAPPQPEQNLGTPAVSIRATRRADLSWGIVIPGLAAVADRIAATTSSASR